MTPLVEISKISKGYLLEKYNEYIERVLDKTLEVLQIPDKQKREIRVPRISDDGNGKEEILRISYPIGSDIYPDFQQKDFNPSEEQRSRLAKEIVQIPKESTIFPSVIEIVEWKGTVFKLFDKRGKIVSEGDDKLERVLKEYTDSKISIYVNSQELLLTFNGVVPNSEIVLVEGSDAPLALEFDIERDISDSNKEELAYELENRLLTRMNIEDVEGEDFKNSTIWIRSGKPSIYRYSGVSGEAI